MHCNLQIFSGCVCHLEQLHAQSPFLFPIVFGINLIPFFDIGSVLAVLCWGSLLGPLRDRNCHCLWLWQLDFRDSLPAAMSNLSLSPTPSERSRCAQRWGKAQDRLLFTIQRCPRISTYKFTAFNLLSAAGHLADGSRERQTSPFNGDAQS